jgi:hypothetical protein
MDPDDFDSGVVGGGRSMGAKIQRAMDRIAAGACRGFLAMRNYCDVLSIVHLAPRFKRLLSQTVQATLSPATVLPCR